MIVQELRRKVYRTSVRIQLRRDRENRYVLQVREKGRVVLQRRLGAAVKDPHAMFSRLALQSDGHLTAAIRVQTPDWQPRLRVPRQAARNALLLRMRDSGASYLALARYFGISKQRVAAILASAGAKAVVA